MGDQVGKSLIGRRHVKYEPTDGRSNCIGKKGLPKVQRINLFESHLQAFGSGKSLYKGGHQNLRHQARTGKAHLRDIG